MKPFVTKNWNPIKKTENSVRMTKQLLSPFKWNSPHAVMVCNVGDLFAPRVSESQIDKVIAIIAANPKHTFIISTHHARRMNQYFNSLEPRSLKMHSNTNSILTLLQASSRVRIPNFQTLQWPLQNLRLGITLKNQQQANKDIPYLLTTPSFIRFLHFEKMSMQIDLSQENENNTNSIELIDWIICDRPKKQEFAIHLKNQSLNNNTPFFYFKKNKVIPLENILYTMQPNDFKLERLMQIIQSEISSQKKRTKKANLRRRYYLHQKVRLFTTVVAPARQVSVNDRILKESTAKQLAYLIELGKMGYNLQVFIE
jgi:protein gp37